MIIQNIIIGDNNWHILFIYDINTTKDISEVIRVLSRFNFVDNYLNDIPSLLRGWNHGCTITNTDAKFSIAIIGKATSFGEFNNTIIHELDHVQNDICNYYNVDNTSEQAAYLIGYIAKKVYSKINFKKYSKLFCFYK